MKNTGPESDWRTAEDYGIDVAQLDRNLELSPSERVRRHSRALELALALRAAAEQRHG